MKTLVLDRFKNDLLSRVASKGIKGGVKEKCCTIECTGPNGSLGSVSAGETCDGSLAICTSFYPDTTQASCWCI